MSDRAWTDDETTIGEMKSRLDAFNADRDWGQFHAPKDLAMCLAIEAGELLEAFLWKREAEPVALAQVREELADVVICALNLASRLDLDLATAVEQKIAANDSRYPVELARGRTDKHDVLRDQGGGD